MRPQDLAPLLAAWAAEHREAQGRGPRGDRPRAVSHRPARAGARGRGVQVCPPVRDRTSSMRSCLRARRPAGCRRVSATYGTPVAGSQAMY